MSNDALEFHAGETVLFFVDLKDDDDRPRTPQPLQVQLTVYTEDGATTLQAATVCALKVLDSGQSTGTNDRLKLVDSNNNWRPNEHAGRLVKITAGTGIGQERRIRTNDAAALYLEKPWTVTPDATSTYEIHASRYQAGYLTLANQEETTIVGVLDITPASGQVSTERQPVAIGRRV